MSFSPHGTMLGMVGRWKVMDVLHSICSNKSKFHLILWTSIPQRWSLGINYLWYIPCIIGALYVWQIHGVLVSMRGSYSFVLKSWTSVFISSKIECSICQYSLLLPPHCGKSVLLCSTDNRMAMWLGLTSKTWLAVAPGFPDPKL